MKEIIIDGVDVSECKFYDNEICDDCYEPIDVPYCKDETVCYYKQLIRKEKECDKLRKLKIHYKNEFNKSIYKLGELIEKNGDLYNKTQQYKKALQEIKEIANGMHDWWINKEEYENVNKLSNHLLGCELNRIIGKISEVEE